MADLIAIKGGNGDVPALQDRELAFRKDEKALYIGSGSTNVRLCGAGDIDALNARIEEIIARLEALEPSTE